MRDQASALANEVARFTIPAGVTLAIAGR
jgi:hypothetical protein